MCRNICLNFNGVQAAHRRVTGIGAVGYIEFENAVKLLGFLDVGSGNAGLISVGLVVKIR
jgi:hypothetical protein